MKRLIVLISLILVVGFFYGCGGGKKYSTSSDIGEHTSYQLGNPITKAQEKVRWARLYISNKKYDDAMKALEEADKILEVANNCDLSLINSRVNLFFALINAEQDKTTKARDYLGKAENDASQATDLLPDDQKQELMKILSDIRELSQSMQLKGKKKEHAEKIFNIYKAMTDLVNKRSAELKEEKK
ncbi:MAG: hypothetical protein ACUVWP_07005 [bacterium]